MASDPDVFTPEDLALIDRVASRIVELRLEVPAVLALEGARPLSLIAGQTLHFLDPLLSTMLGMTDLRRFAHLIERRATIDQLLSHIERGSDAAHDARRAARRSGP